MYGFSSRITAAINITLALKSALQQPYFILSCFSMCSTRRVVVDVYSAISFSLSYLSLSGNAELVIRTPCVRFTPNFRTSSAGNFKFIYAINAWSDIFLYFE